MIDKGCSTEVITYHCFLASLQQQKVIPGIFNRKFGRWSFLRPVSIVCKKMGEFGMSSNYLDLSFCVRLCSEPIKTQHRLLLEKMIGMICLLLLLSMIAMICSSTESKPNQQFFAIDRQRRWWLWRQLIRRVKLPKASCPLFPRTACLGMTTKTAMDFPSFLYLPPPRSSSSPIEYSKTVLKYHSCWIWVKNRLGVMNVEKL
ncbi:hypothetical protein G4B88_011263 [Cannabis sativa]|uniref:Uncharacterized protein n=1 Tax=Cannabis sativa TaxID=3483 RepID=A0A7J6DP72_CANSA|nr:hypothetical protein G4B88_011263 [Cannabis sativa]